MKERYGKKVTSLDLLRMLSDAIYALEQDSHQETDDPISEDFSGKALFTESQEKYIEYIHCFYVENVAVFCVFTIVNLPTKLYHVFF